MQAADGDLAKIDVAAIARPPWFVPDIRPLSEQLKAFRRRKTHFALVVDEYGEVMGLVTLEDILEEIVGDISDEHDVTVSGVQAAARRLGVVDGAVPIRDLNRMMDWDLPDEEATTIAGLVIHEARTIPGAGQSFTFHGFRFRVLKKERNRITALHVTPLNRKATSRRWREVRMQTKPIPSSGEPLGVIGLGTYLGFDVKGRSRYAQLQEVLHRLLEPGGSVIDSSPMYGHAEGVTGELAAASGTGKRTFLATKVWTRGEQAGIAQMNRSMELHAHRPPRPDAGAQPARLARASEDAAPHEGSRAHPLYRRDALYVERLCGARGGAARRAARFRAAELLGDGPRGRTAAVAAGARTARRGARHSAVRERIGAAAPLASRPLPDVAGELAARAGRSCCSSSSSATRR